MAGSRLPHRATAKKAKYSDTYEDADLADIAEDQDTYTPDDATDLDAESDQGDLQDTPGISDAESVALTPMANKKRKRSALKKVSKAKAKPVRLEQPVQRKISKPSAKINKTKGASKPQNPTAPTSTQTPMPPKIKKSSKATKPAAKSLKSKKKPLPEFDDLDELLALIGDHRAAKKDPYKSYSEGVAQGSNPTTDPKVMIHSMVKTLIEILLAESVDLDDIFFRLKVATVCSGTEIPIVVLDIAAKYLHQLKTHDKKSFPLLIEHMFSSDIVPFKQAYIQRNFNPPCLFRDITEFIKGPDEDGIHRATTAFGSRKPVPTALDILIAGFCCVDFSLLNAARKALEDLGESGDSLCSILVYLITHKPKILILENVARAPWSDKVVSRKKTTASPAGAKGPADLEELDTEDEMTDEMDTEDEITEEMDEDICERQPKIKKDVDDASLSRGIEWHLAEIGYKATHILVDSKKYRIPQTRERGYLVAVNVEEFGRTMPGATKEQIMHAISDALSKWKALMKEFESPACVPVDAMLVGAEDHKLTTKLRSRDFETEDKKAVPWLESEGDHRVYRAENDLGDEKGLLNWEEDGYRNYPDHWAYMKGMTSRVCDVFEITHLRSIVRGFDDRFYTRLLDLSQNVHRNQDSVKDGIIGCLTPKGIPFWTYQGRRISGREALIMQGLPVNMLDLSHLAESDLQDFAGNAMTSTVIAAAMFSALVTFRSILAHRPDPAIKIESPGAGFVSAAGLPHKNNDPATCSEKLSVADAKLKAAQSISLCHCEGRHGKLDKLFLRCSVCKHTGCIECTGNPKHSFEALCQEDMSERIFPASFQQVLEKSLPTKISLSQIGDVVKNISTKNPNAGALSWTCLEKHYMAAVSSVMFLKQIHRRHIWEVVYESQNSRLVLSICASKVEWLLYAVAETGISYTNPLRLYLEAHPIARLHPVGDDITQGDWSVFLPQHQIFDATITSSGTIVPSYESLIGLKQHNEQYIFGRCSVSIQTKYAQLFETDITGDYEAHRQCGQAFNSFHIKSSTKNDLYPVYFFLDHTNQRGDPWRHQYVFTHDPRRRKPLEGRQLISQLAPDTPFPIATHMSPEVPRNLSWRQPKIKRDIVNGGVDRYQFRTSSASDANFEDVMGSIAEFEIVDRVKAVSSGFWIKSGLSIKLGGSALTSYQQIPAGADPSLFLVNTSCRESRRIFACQAEVPDYTLNNYPLGEIITQDATNEAQVTNDFRWLLQPILSVPGYRVGSEQWFPFNSNAAHCFSCAPDRPELYWAIGKKSKKQEPFEDPETAAVYERSLKGRAKAIDFRFIMKRDLDQNKAPVGSVAVEVSVNFMTLAHKALFDLDPSRNMGKIEVLISLITDARPTPLKPFTPFNVPDSRNMQRCPNVDDFAEFNDYQLPAKFKLRHEQSRSVAWQVNQENSRPIFLEEIVVEEQSSFGYRASAKVSRQVEVGGGLLLHPVGFGKTAVILGLISYQKEADETWARQDSEIFPGRIPLSATLIFMPSQLTGQWREETEKFLGPKVKKQILVIHDIRQFRAASIKAYQEALIVIVNWNLLESPHYVENLAQFAGIIGIDDKPLSRTYSAFHQAAMARIGNNIDILRSDSSRFKDLVDEQIIQNLNDISDNKKPVPSKRLRGSAYVNAGSRPGTSEQGQSSTLTYAEISDYKLLPKGPSQGESWNTTKCVPLEAFAWPRVVVDEFPLMSESASSVLTEMSKKNLWLVSATPGLNDFEKVRHLAAHFGVNLGIKDLSLMEHDVWKQNMAAMTASEKFLACESSRSSVWHDHRLRKAQEFVNRYAICDEPSYDQIKSREVIKLSLAPAAQLAASQELMRVLATSTSGAIPRQLSTTSNADFQREAVINDSKTAVVALMKQASYFNNYTDIELKMVHKTPAATSAAVDATIQRRESLLDAQKAKFMECLEQIFWLAEHEEAGYAVQKWQNINFFLLANRWGDSDLCTELNSLIAVAKAKQRNDPEFNRCMAEKFPSGATKRSGAQTLALADAMLRKDVNTLTRILDEIFKLRRELRFMKAVETCQRQSDSITPIACEFCSQLCSVSDIKVLTECGHIFCNKCIEKRAVCGIQGCKSGCGFYRMTSGNRFAIREDNDNIPTFGQKAEDLVSLITGFPGDEKALLFVQSNFLIGNVCRLFDESGISYGVLGAKHDSVKCLAAFQKNEGNKKVLILEITSESAAGCNLTIAQHVIFFGPLMTVGSNGQSTYDATMKQAIGRALRYGQKAPYVNIYHLMTAYTVDVDLFEHRNQQIVAQVGDEYQRRDRVGDQRFGEFASCVPHLVHAPGGAYIS